MSQSNFVYPQPISSDLTLIHNSPWQVREDEDEYGNKSDLPT